MSFLPISLFLISLFYLFLLLFISLITFIYSCLELLHNDMHDFL